MQLLKIEDDEAEEQQEREPLQPELVSDPSSGDDNLRPDSGDRVIERRVPTGSAREYIRQAMVLGDRLDVRDLRRPIVIPVETDV